VPTISVHSLKTLWIYKTESRGWQHFSDLTLVEASSLKVTIPDQPYANIAQALIDLQIDQIEIRDQLDNVQLKMGLMHQKIDDLILLTSLMHRGVKLVV